MKCFATRSKYEVKNFDKAFFFILLRPMKIDPSKVILITLAILCGNLTFAAPNPPAPIPPPPPGLPVDEGLVFLALSSVAYVLYKLSQYKKASN